MTFREITAQDLPAIPGLLCEGFPSTTPGFWVRALDALSKRAPVPDLPRYGIVLDNDGTLDGVMLMVSHESGEATYCNLSSWYVRDSHRGLATFMFGHALRTKGVTFLDCSPTPGVVPIIEKFGFQPYTGGSLLLDPRVALKRGPTVSRLTRADLAQIEPAERARLDAHLDYGCQGFLAHDAKGAPTPILYRVARLKRHIPVARFVHGAPDAILAHAGSILRHLIARAVPLALVDWPAQTEAPFGRALPSYGVRYRRGETAPALGDLLDTEYAVFGI